MQRGAVGERDELEFRYQLVLGVVGCPDEADVAPLAEEVVAAAGVLASPTGAHVVDDVDAAAVPVAARPPCVFVVSVRIPPRGADEEVAAGIDGDDGGVVVVVLVEAPGPGHGGDGAVAAQGQVGDERGVVPVDGEIVALLELAIVGGGHARY